MIICPDWPTLTSRTIARVAQDKINAMVKHKVGVIRGQIRIIKQVYETQQHTEQYFDKIRLSN